MVSDINILRSHPDKLLLDHVNGVTENTKKLTNSRIAELVAIYHDLGKINPNFQNKLDPDKTVNGYANHSYLSAYTFFCAFGCSRQNMEALKQFLEVDTFNQNDLIALTVSIAKHHGNLPDFSPTDYSGTGASILSKEENAAMFKFLDKEKDLPIFEFVNHFISIDDFRQLLTNPRVQQGYIGQLVFKGENNKSALDFFLINQFVFASVIQADKADAAKFDNFIDNQFNDVEAFSNVFSSQLDIYFGKLNQDSALNQLRTTIRRNAVINIQKELKHDKRVYELTAPTGSGKTLMLLSLASVIINAKGAKRIIYGLPFLSITEQVESEVLKIYPESIEYIQRIDSKSENNRFEDLQKELENNPTEEKILEANLLEFQENTFAYPFIITTFVRFFETLLSNRNAELLKLPNFSKCIFLLDEIQALPPRLYGFFVAYLNKFCEKFDSYAIISTATQPNFNIPQNNPNANKFFPDYKTPTPLLPLSYFENDLFNRYQIEFNKEPIELEILKEQILLENQSTLIILNTIDDTIELFKLLKDELDSEEILLLNTHFTPEHRKQKIAFAKERLNQKRRIIVVSTQLIEAGVDIDFPILYRDFATVSSIVQSAGRCNRNGKLESFGKVKLIKLRNKGKIRSDIIYRGKDSEILSLTKNSFIKNHYQEKELLEVQKQFFNQIQSDLDWAKHSQKGIKPDFDFIKDIQECQFDKIGKFQLIDKQLFGEEVQYFVSKNDCDNQFEELLQLHDELIDLLKDSVEYSLLKMKKKSIETHLKKMSGQIVQVRLNKNQIKPLQGSDRHYFFLYKISDCSYSFEKGIDLRGAEFII
jgi:CRISPR-associated endonuclease/helicase Cas3